MLTLTKTLGKMVAKLYDAVKSLLLLRDFLPSANSQRGPAPGEGEGLGKARPLLKQHAVEVMAATTAQQ